MQVRKIANNANVQIDNYSLHKFLMLCIYIPFVSWLYVYTHAFYIMDIFGRYLYLSV